MGGIMKKSRLLGAVCACIFMLVISNPKAATITYTGSDLFNDPNVSFPTTTPTLAGDSLVFGTSTSGGINKLLVVPLFSAGALSLTSPTTVSISLNLTRLACVLSVGCAGNTIEDSDQHIVLGDGSSLVGVNAGDGVYNGYDGTGGSSVLTDLGTTADFHPSLSQTLFTDPGYPDIGSSFEVNVQIILGTTTEVSLSYLAGSGTDSGLLGLDRTAEIDFAFLSDGDPGEQYQINSLAISSPAIVPIPPAFWLFGTGLLGLIGVARRKNDKGRS